MSLDRHIRKLAIDEVVSSSCELTKQYLHSNKLLFEDGKPVIEDIIIEEGGTGAQVYFSVLDEKYYFVVYLDINDTVSLRCMGMSAGNSVELRVVSEESLLPELLEQLDFTPSDQWEKGQPIRVNYPVLYKHNGFKCVLATKRTGEVEDKLKELIEFLMPRKERIVQLAEIASTEISIAYYGYKDEMWGIHFDAETLSAVAQLGLSIDIDLYASGPDLE